MKHSKLIWIPLVLIILFSLFYGYKVFENSRIPEPIDLPPLQVYEPKEPKEVVPESLVTPNQEEPEKVPVVVPSELHLRVPFTPQAPTANWDELHNEACEEASVLMAAAYFNGDKRVVKKVKINLFSSKIGTGTLNPARNKEDI